MFDSHLLLPVLAMLSLAAATLVSEDLTCIGAGVLVAEGSLSISLAIAGCFIGIVGGDILLMLGGRWLGHVGLRAPFVRRFVTAEVLDGSIQWMRERGAIAVALSRFVPGTRLATYVTAGALGIGFWRFAISVSVTALVWVPAVVAASALAGATIVQAGLSAASTWVAVTAVSSMAIGAAVRIPKRFSAWRICRQFLGLWRRWTRWEFWPMWALYMPLTPYLIGLALKHRSLTLFTAANPDIPAGGFIGESKFDILRNLAARWSAGCAVRARTCGSATRASDRHRSGIHGSHATYLSHCSQARSWTARIGGYSSAVGGRASRIGWRPPRPT